MPIFVNKYDKIQFDDFIKKIAILYIMSYLILIGMDPWVIQPRERQRYQEQFESLNPINGVVTGEQAKGFLLRSQLQPAILGHIW